MAKSPAFNFIEQEWNTPNTYDKNHKDVPKSCGVYLLIYRNYNAIKMTKLKYEILYVGSSKNLKQRYDHHEVQRILRAIYGDVVFYFRETKDYIEIEKKLIKQTEARFNKQWR